MARIVCDALEVDEYNYPHFTADQLAADEFEAFRDLPTRVGNRAPDGVVTDVRSGETLQLASLWAKNHVVLEFGSFT